MGFFFQLSRRFFSYSAPYDKNHKSFLKEIMCLSDVCTTLQILLNFHKTDKNKKGARLTKSKLYGILMRKILFHDAKMIPKLSFFEHVPFLRQYVFFPSHERKTYIIFRSEALTQLL